MCIFYVYKHHSNKFASFQAFFAISSLLTSSYPHRITIFFAFDYDIRVMHFLENAHFIHIFHTVIHIIFAFHDCQVTIFCASFLHDTYVNSNVFLFFA